MSKHRVVFAAVGALLVVFTVYFFVHSLQEPEHVHSRDDVPQEQPAPEANLQDRIRSLELQMQNSPENFQILMALGHVYLEAQNFQGARKVFRKAVEVNPQSAEAMVDLAIAMRKTGAGDDALVMLKNTTQKFPDYAEGWLQLGVIYRFDKKNNVEALKSFQKYVQLKESNEVLPGVLEEIHKIQAELKP